MATLAGLAAALGMSIPLARGDARGATIPVSEIKEGMKGYGLTVFHGTQPERFDVEVIGVLHNFQPSQDLILIKTPNNARLDIAKGVHGMSGSPIYLDGRLAGAYSYLYSNFPAEPVAGVTPIAPMLTELHRPIPRGFWPIEGGGPLPSPPSPQPVSSLGPGGGGATTYDGVPGSYDLDAHAAQIADRLRTGAASSLMPAVTPLFLAGLGPRTAAYLGKLFEPLGFEVVQGGGGGQGKAEPGEPEHFVDGGSIGVQLIAGDISSMGFGTVTHVEGKRLCAFGHPMSQAGNIALPTALLRVLWIHASLMSSVKIAEPIRQLGALVQDRLSAVVADEDVHAPTFPVSVEIHGVQGAVRTSWKATLAEERFMSSSLTAAVIGTAIDATTSERRDVTWKLVSKVSVHGHGTITLEDFGVAIGGTPDPSDFGHSRVVRAVGDVLNNPWEMSRVEKVESVLSIEYARDVWRLRGVEAQEDTVDAGGEAHIVMHLVPFVGKEITKTVDVKIPVELAGKEVDIEVVPGYEVAPDLPAPEDLTEMLANETRQSALPMSVVVQFKVPSEGVTFHGHVAPRLPPFALDALRPAHSDLGPEPFYSYARTTVPLQKYVEGRDHVKLKVRAVLR
ncbi:MAG: SpoIVB peptidase S55 domain-containing protein [Polyangiaceae bacterium]